MDFIDTYMRYVEPTKGSRAWNLWSCIAMLSAAMERKCWRPLWDRTIFPNMYITLNGKPGTGKTFCSESAMYFIYRLNKRMKAKGKPGIMLPTDKLTPASLIKQLEAAKKSFKQPGKDRVEYSSLFSYASELSSFIVDIGGGSISHDILKFFDCPDPFTKHIITGGLTSIRNVSFACLWDTTPAFLQRHMPREISGEGLTSRIIFVTDLETHYYDRIPPKPDHRLVERLDQLLERIFNMVGEFREEPEAQEFLDNWHKNIYSPRHAQLRGHSAFITYHARKKLHVHKLCMISAASRSSFKITKKDAERALEWLDDIEAGMQHSFGVQTINKDPDAPYRLLEYIPHEGIYEDALIQSMIQDGIIFSQDFSWVSALQALTKGNLLKIVTRGDKQFFIRVRDEEKI